ncbi:uncharacterized protein MONOS_18212 [Monocercomonoides exilis]|uniref:uncharacterized protein n=1 Tax=Monocercomonoides exilis TaxID=2049356 RepID=UPI0035593B44|nr:hypothetical protein MONOS_18212 [Monocercomonoides exilis]
MCSSWRFRWLIFTIPVFVVKPGKEIQYLKALKDSIKNRKREVKNEKENENENERKRKDGWIAMLKKQPMALTNQIERLTIAATLVIRVHAMLPSRKVQNESMPQTENEFSFSFLVFTLLSG